MKDIFKFERAPDWAPSISDEQVLSFAKDAVEKQRDYEEIGKKYSPLVRKYLRTSNVSDQEYSSIMYLLNDSDTLLSAGVIEKLVQENQEVIIHRIVVVRNGVIFDKTKDSTARVFDNEQESKVRIINKEKKLNILVQDLHINDIYFLEYTLVTLFRDTDILPKTFFKFDYWPPSEYWVYGLYEFVLIQERDEPIVYSWRYLRNEQRDILPEDAHILYKGEKFETYKKNYNEVHLEDDIVAPFINFTTKKTWEEISSTISPYYEKELIDAKGINFLEYIENATNIDQEGTLLRSYIEYVQNNIVYTFNAYEMHGHVPQSVEKTLQEKSGDCKAKAVLLVAMLRSIQLDAEVVLINYNLDYFIPSIFPSPFSFNHAIVKLIYQGEEYFIDPVWRNSFGLIQHRQQPLFTHFLPILSNTTLQKNNKPIPQGFEIEEEVFINLKKEGSTLENVSTYRRGSADNARRSLVVYGNDELLKNEHKINIERFSLQKNKEAKDLFLSGEIIKVRDDQDKNELVLRYLVILKEPYQVIGKQNVFKYYYPLNTDTLQKYKHKDLPLFHTFKFSQKITLVVVSSLFSDVSDKTTKKNCTIDNDYFSFSNKKEITRRRTKVVSIYKLKKNKEIESKDIELLKKDYLTIVDSNYGIGLVQGSFFSHFRISWYAILWFIIIFSQIIRAGISNN